MILEKHQVGIEAVKILSFLHQESFRGGEVWDESSFIDLLTMRGVLAFLVTYRTPLEAEEAAVPVGFIVTRECCDEVEIITLGVLPSKRRLGIGRYLVNLMIEEVKRKKSSLLLEVNIANESALNLYFSLGFKEVGYRKGYYQDGGDALLLKRV